MSKIILAIGAALIAVGEAILDQTPATTGDDNAAPAGGGEAPKRRGRPPVTQPSPTGGADKPASTAAPAEDAEKERNAIREIYQPLIEGGRGEEVKALIMKYSPTGMGAMKPENFAAFKKDINALLM